MKTTFFKLRPKTAAFVCVVVVSLAFYFVFSVFFIPEWYQSLEKPTPIPHLSEISISKAEVILGESFEIDVTGTNQGDFADIQIVSVSFPNLTKLDGVTITSYDFKQSPFLIEISDKVGTNYGSSTQQIPAKYPSVEAYSRPWKSNETYHMTLEIIPEKQGRFVMYVKAVGLPHTEEQSHFPNEGFLDYQNELVNVYSVFVNP